jgi:hypothetical protein
VVDVTAKAADHAYQGTALTRIEGNSLTAVEAGTTIGALSAINHPFANAIRASEPIVDFKVEIPLQVD